MKLTRRRYLLLAKHHTPKVCSMTLALFGHKATVTLGFEDTQLRGTWSVAFGQALLKEAREVQR